MIAIDEGVDSRDLRLLVITIIVEL